jgi:naphthalene 1,2-dioxygenase ferredoxin reductase component
MVAGKPSLPAAAAQLAYSRPLWGRVIDLEDATPCIRIVHIDVVHGGSFRFAAGQYAQVAFGEQRPRPLSMANRPDQTVLEFHLRHADSGGAAAAMARQLRRGDGVWMEGPYGDAWLRAQHTGPILAIAGGSGLAPAKSIVETALRVSPDRTVWLYFGARDTCDVYLAEHFRALARRCPNFRYVPVLSASDSPGQFRTGLVADAVAADFSSLVGCKAYVFGPPPMVTAARALLGLRRVPSEDVHGDAVVLPEAAG